MSKISGWASWKLEDCCDILDSMRVPVNSEERAKRIGDVPYYGANGLQGYIDDFIFDEQLILMAEDGGRFNEFATRPIAYQIRGKSWVNNHAHVLRAKSGFCQDAVFYTLEHKDIQSFIVGGTRAKLNQQALRSIEISLPKKEQEQSDIAEILRTVDRAIAQMETLLVKQRRFQTGLIQDLLTRGIDDKGNLRSEETHQFKNSALGRIPIEWEEISLQQLVHIKHGHAFSGEHFTDQVNDNILLTPGNFHVHGGLYFTKENTKYYTGKVIDDYVLHNGDVIVVMTDLTKEMAILARTVVLNHPRRILHNQRIGKIIANKGVNLDAQFIAILMNSETHRDAIKSTATGTTVRHTSPEKLLTPLVPEIDFEEQVRIRDRITEIESLIQCTSKQIEKTTSLKMALMQDLLTGKKRATPLLGSALTN